MTYDDLLKQRDFTEQEHKRSYEEIIRESSYDNNRVGEENKEITEVIKDE